MTLLLASDPPVRVPASKAREDAKKRQIAEALALAAILAILGVVGARIVARILMIRDLDLARVAELRRELAYMLAETQQRLASAFAESWRQAAMMGDAAARAQAALIVPDLHVWTQGASNGVTQHAVSAADDVAGQVVAGVNSRIGRILTIGATQHSTPASVAAAVGTVPPAAAPAPTLFVMPVFRTPLSTAFVAAPKLPAAPKGGTGFLGQLAAEVERKHRTESGTLAELASRERMASIAKDSPYHLTKTWVTTLDGRERPTHNAANRQTVGIDESFIVGGFACAGPMDPSLPASEVANCRCVSALGRAERKAGR